MAKSPAFRFYPKDWLTDERVSAMSHEQQGLYLRALCLCWLNGSLPDEPHQLARLLRVDVRRLRRLWPKIAPCFSPVENQTGERRIVQRRLEHEREIQQKLSTFRRDAVRQRWGKP